MENKQYLTFHLHELQYGIEAPLVQEIFSLPELTPLAGIRSDFGEQYIRGSALFQEKMLRVLELPKIFRQGELVVNEEA
jgi:purine-binding chemotaxis protein CheW